MLKPERKLSLWALLMLPLCLAISGWFCIAYFGFGDFKNATETKPRVMLWAWEAPSDLRWIDSDRIGVAFLAETVTLRNDGIWAKPRMQPLKVNPETYLTSVIRIETSTREKPTLSNAQLDLLVANIIRKSKLPGVKSVQIDFDARSSEREFYKSLLTRLRNELPSNVDLSMTALASWCLGDRWLANTPADEIVPMFFSMGADTKQVAHHLKTGRGVNDFARQKAIGLAESSDEVIQLISDENKKQLLSGRRLYLFSARTWTKDRMESLLRRVGTI